MSIKVVSGTFGALGNGTAFMPENASTPEDAAPYNIAIFGTFVGTVVLEKSYDNGTTYIPVNRMNTGTPISFTAPATEVCFEPEDGVLTRFRCSAFTSGTISYRLSQ
jgi:hypothetical protein